MRPGTERIRPSKRREGREVRDSWLQVRASEDQKETWKRAAITSSHDSLSSWVLATLGERAAEIMFFEGRDSRGDIA